MFQDILNPSLNLLKNGRRRFAGVLLLATEHNPLDLPGNPNPLPSDLLPI